MAPVRRLLLIALLVLPLAACGGSSKPAADTGVSDATAHTVAAKTASFQLLISGTLGKMSLQSSESGSVSFTDRRAHFYKLVPGGGLPQEVVLSGPFTYANANIDAAVHDSTVKPWTKLDTRRLSAQQVAAHPDELGHVRALAYLADGVSKPARVGTETVEGTTTTHLRGTVDPKRVTARIPAVRRAIRDDYPAAPFPADFWVDSAGRLRRVLVRYSTPKGTKISLDGGFSDFGAAVDLTVPPAQDVQDITP
jgi:hypothetical protein